ncbi:putative dehydrogenase [Dyadobacter sp. BE34]|uniref:Dehydrogenase n=1 Tax=Dyadobacter fermentans TaxID=94254 RepID=A0ABU1QYP4_9BACT|nr:MULTISPECIES: Gfo/Idh/MocA family oxidoreductase [Dyadobacter]MDR6806278.1 putative dehydrogenase [Dyadobacter fermentans]MDR7044019.1 putative dehydrogenase [Dyadobacter sp. BE242]MDR7198330.1 putative dehydrogenase [Dyadobacter sp. BE34]MDR7216292.1 putative dehydrogenase [Dyadobacter sp. BE31]MDR7264182.1 putative dehydrogenase [Dyadobacter sp. BE32]
MKPNRRNFLKNVTAASALLATESIAKPFHIIKDLKKISPNDKIRFATIGMGIQGHSDTKAALRSSQDVEFVAAADLYDGRLTRVKELYGKDIFTTRDYRQILERKDIDAVLVVTPDHWHDHITKAALQAGKNVYCEKPMVHHINEGLSVIEAWKKSGKTMQVGSQRISSASFKEAKRLFQAGEIGEINYVESNNDRFNAIGAWNYSIPTDASPSTVDWDTYLGDAPKRAFDAKRFFRWRNYQDYGTGVGGDLFVHLITGVHFVTNSLGPERVMSSGELSYWKDGRDVPDVLVSILDYPKTDIHANFQMVLRVNFANAGAIANNTRIIGTEGQIEFTENNLVLTKKKLPKAPGMGGYDSFNTFSEAQQKEFKKQYDAQYPEDTRKAEPVKEVRFEAPKEDDAHANHFRDFFENVKKGSVGTVEDPVFGFRAAAPVLACNESYFSKKIVHWDPVAMKMKKK